MDPYFPGQECLQYTGPLPLFLMSQNFDLLVDGSVGEQCLLLHCTSVSVSLDTSRDYLRSREMRVRSRDGRDGKREERKRREFPEVFIAVKSDRCLFGRQS